MTTFFSDGFESGTILTTATPAGAWTSNVTGLGGTSTVVTSPVRQGNYAEDLKLPATAGAAALTATDLGSNKSTIYARCYIYLSSLPASGHYIQISPNLSDSGDATDIVMLDIYNTGSAYRWELRYRTNSAEIDYTEGNGGGTSSTSPSIATGTWYCIELKWIGASGGGGEVRLYINGVQKCYATGLTNDNVLTREVYLANYSTAALAVDEYVDSVVVADAYIGPIGTTTYNITASADANSSISPSGTVQVNSGDNETFSISANSGYQISHVYVDSVDQGSIASYTFTNVQATHTISVTSSSSGSGQWTAGAVSSVTNGVKISGSALQFDSSYSPTFTGATVNGVMNSNATGSSPVAGSNAGMILDCYTVNHTDGLGIQSGGIWMKYDNSFNLYQDSTTALTNSLHIDSSGTTKLISLNVTNPNGTYGYISLGDMNPMFVKASGYPLGINHNSPAIIASTGGSSLLFDAQLGSNGALTNSWTAFESKGSNSLQLAPNGSVITQKNTLDDGSGKMTLAASLNINAGIQISNDAANLSYINTELPTQNAQYISSHYAYTGTGYGNILFYHNGNENPSNYIAGRYASLYLVMIQDPTGNYNPKIATDQGLFAEKDIFTYGALFTESDPAKTTGGGAVIIGHGFFNSTEPPCIVVPDNGYGTLHIYTNAATQSHGDLELNTLWVDGSATISNWLTVGAFANTSTRGPLYAASSGLIGYTQSTIAGKENVEELEDCTWLYELRPVSFDWKNAKRKQEEGRRIGLIAEEVDAVSHQLVWYDDKHQPEGVHYEWLSVPIIVELKKLKTEIDNLKTRLSTLKSD